MRMIPGPVDRVAFFDEQARRRQQTWRFTALAGLTAAVVGVPLAMFLTPAVYFLTVLWLRLVDTWGAVPDEVWGTLRELARFVPAFMDALGNTPDDEVLPWLRQATASVDYPFGSPLLTILALIVPGMAATVAVWLAYRSLFRRAGVGGALLALGAREPRPDDFEERQLVNVVEEMAVAAGLPPPALRLLDSDVPNAALVGSSHEDAVLVISRGLLNRLDRDETQGTIAHLVGSAGNGDLGIALSITTVFQSSELVFTVLEALFNLSGSAWRDLYWTVRLGVTGGRDVGAAERVARMLDHRLGETREDGITALLGESEKGEPKRRLARILRRLPMLYVVFLPFLILYILALLLRMQVAMFRITFVGPLLMRVWRTRRYLADATGVELTRNPDGLARALTYLAEHRAVVPGGQWFSHLFIVGPEAGRGSEGMGKTWAQELAGVPSHPGIPQRVHRLEAQGAAIRRDAPETRRRPERPHSRLSGLRAGVLGLAGAIVMVPLMALASILMAGAMTAIFLFGLVAALFFMGMAMAGIHALLV
jgi:Zn-dependent protease with chaperone function